MLLPLLLTACQGHRGASPAMLDNFAQVDTALSQENHYRSLIEVRLAQLHDRAANAGDPEERYFCYRYLADLYQDYMLDSAIVYVDRCYRLAHELRRPEWMAESSVMQARICFQRGALQSTSEALDEARSLPMTPELNLDYYYQQLSLWVQRSIESEIFFLPEVRRYADSIFSLEPDSCAPIRLATRFWVEETANREDLRQLTMQQIDRTSPDNPWYAELCCNVSVLSTESRQVEDRIKYLSRGAIADIRHARRSFLMLSLLASAAAEQGELAYAHRFTQACLNREKEYSDTESLVSDPAWTTYTPLPATDIYEATIEHLEEDAHAHRRAFWSLVLSFDILVLLLVVIFILFRRQIRLKRQMQDNLSQLARLHADLQEAHTALGEKQRLLEDTNANLVEANYLKEECIGYAFILSADYLSQMTGLHRDLTRKLKAKQYDDALRQLSGTGPYGRLASSGSRNLMARFDSMFLGLFPDFVKQFNALLQPEASITPRGGEQLNTDLRIYALVRLGVTNSLKIAHILGLSPQTVYNIRVRVRHSALPLPDDGTTFVDLVRRIEGKKAPDATAPSEDF